jgi:hypothetical protein
MLDVVGDDLQIVSHGFSKNSQHSVAHGLGRIVTKLEAEGLVRGDYRWKITSASIQLPEPPP